MKLQRESRTRRPALDDFNSSAATATTDRGRRENDNGGPATQPTTAALALASAHQPEAVAHRETDHQYK